MSLTNSFHDPEMDEGAREMVAEKRAAYEAVGAKKSADAGAAGEAGAGDALVFPPGSMVCDKCNTKALVMMDTCQTCLNYGYSRCG